MHVIFLNVNSEYQYMFTPGKEYPVIATNKVYGLKVLTDNEKECWVSENQSLYGEKQLLNV